MKAVSGRGGFPCGLFGGKGALGFNYPGFVVREDDFLQAGEGAVSRGTVSRWSPREAVKRSGSGSNDGSRPKSRFSSSGEEAVRLGFERRLKAQVQVQLVGAHFGQLESGEGNAKASVCCRLRWGYKE
ncbi:uncharacterized protein A4U43_C05F34740 [Asparagus officinalis]|uniref:Uncharacterized protein n=1 Tax=Asparagus officinalis TaxID=4686 RepID=A0A5P1EZG0_ASPOF|nr:uncharacterized protein A4U43_C05F34740 [Asparagus officinalis]